MSRLEEPLAKNLLRVVCCCMTSSGAALQEHSVSADPVPFAILLYDFSLWILAMAIPDALFQNGPHPCIA